jgi:UDP-N-acetylmuramoylalanine--D-glutamate ligase
MLVKKLKFLKGKKIGLLGLGIENFALLNYFLNKRIECEITVCDRRSKKELGPEIKKYKNIKWQLGEKIGQRNLARYDYLFRSPGGALNLPDIKKAIKKGAKITSPMKLFFNLCPTKNIIGITGTKGKGTTAALVYKILKTAGKRAWLGGNIGIAPFSFLDKIKQNDWVVLELSSFQLEDLKTSPKIAVITNFSEEHLAGADPNNPNYHHSIRDYWRAKSNIFKWQKRGDCLIINKNLRLKEIELKNKIKYFAKSDLPSRLIGEHNKENIAAAKAAAKAANIENKIIKKAVNNFKGFEHRLEFVKKINGLKYYNDTFATTPESTIVAIKSFQEPIVLLAGGADKGANFSDLAGEIKNRVKFIVLLAGKATPRIKKELIKIKFSKNKMKTVSNIKSAVRIARQKAVRGDIILLSAACASFGMFKNYKERGRLFKKEVLKIKTKP